MPSPKVPTGITRKEAFGIAFERARDTLVVVRQFPFGNRPPVPTPYRVLFRDHLRRRDPATGRFLGRL